MEILMEMPVYRYCKHGANRILTHLGHFRVENKFTSRWASGPSLLVTLFSYRNTRVHPIDEPKSSRDPTSCLVCFPKRQSHRNVRASHRVALRCKRVTSTWRLPGSFKPKSGQVALKIRSFTAKSVKNIVMSHSKLLSKSYRSYSKAYSSKFSKSVP